MVKSIGLPIIAGRDARVLVLGTLPGLVALKQREYYAHRQNCFWKIMGALIGFSPDLPYESRLRLLESKRIAVWNVLAEAERQGSIDTNIRSPVPNDFSTFFKTQLELQLICFNGQKAQTLFKRLVSPTLPERAALLPSIILPSTSPTNARIRFEEKLARWREALISALEGNPKPKKTAPPRDAANR